MELVECGQRRRRRLVRPAAAERRKKKTANRARLHRESKRLVEIFPTRGSTSRRTASPPLLHAHNQTQTLVQVTSGFVLAMDTLSWGVVRSPHTQR